MLTSSIHNPSLMSASEQEKLHILVVDDQELISRTTARCLKSAGFEVVVANGVADARKKIESMLQNGGLHAVVTDWDMPPEGNGAGAHVLAAGRQSGVNSLVAMSGRLNFDEKNDTVEENDTKRDMREAGAREFLAKPFSPAQVIAAVKAVLGAKPDGSENE